MTEKQKEYESKDMPIAVGQVSELTDDQKFERRSPGVPAAQADSPNAVIMMAMQNNYTPELIEKMMDLQTRHEADQARKAYYHAMSAWKAKALEITKDKKVSFQTSKGTTEYHHATLANVTKAINTSMSPFGLHTSWRLEQPEGGIKVTCRCSHEFGHFEETAMTGPLDNSGSKNVIQQSGSTITYLQRYTILALTGLSPDESFDDDGHRSETPVGITETQIADIETMVTDLIESKGLKDAKDFDTRLMRLFKVKKIDELTEVQANSLIKKLGQIK